MVRANAEIRDLMRKNRIPVWAVAAASGIHENTLLRRLRFELPTSEREHVLRIVERLAHDRDEKEAEKNV